LLNAVTLFLQGFDLERQHLNLIRIADNLFTILFILEMVIKIREYRFSGYWKSNWNKFDAVLIILATPSLILWLLNIGNVGLQVLLVFRIARVFKFFRFIQFIPNVNKLIRGINQTLKASVIVIHRSILDYLTTTRMKTNKPLILWMRYTIMPMS
jgi:voltage-gated sodium channel